VLQAAATDASSSMKVFHSVASLKSLNRNGIFAPLYNCIP